MIKLIKKIVKIYKLGIDYSFYKYVFKKRFQLTLKLIGNFIKKNESYIHIIIGIIQIFK